MQYKIIIKKKKAAEKLDAKWIRIKVQWFLHNLTKNECALRK